MHERTKHCIIVLLQLLININKYISAREPQDFPPMVLLGSRAWLM